MRTGLRRAFATMGAVAVLISGCGETVRASILLANESADEVVLQLDKGVGNVEPEEAARDRIEVIVYGDGRLLIQEEEAGTVDQATLDQALEELGALLARPQESQELARRMLSDNDDGGVARITAIVDGETIDISLPGYVHLDRGSEQEAETVRDFRRDFSIVADPDFWGS